MKKSFVIPAVFLFAAVIITSAIDLLSPGWLQDNQGVIFPVTMILTVAVAAWSLHLEKGEKND